LKDREALLEEKEKTVFDRAMQAANDEHQELLKREALLEEKEKSVFDRARQTVKREQKELEHQKEELKKFESSIVSVHHAVLDWVKRRERDQIQVYKEILENVEKYKKYESLFSKMDGPSFEKYVAHLMELDGYQNVQVTKASGDFGADILAEHKRVKYVVQCKYYSAPVGVHAIMECIAAKVHYLAHVGVVATNSTFTPAAKNLADENQILLWDCSEVDKLANSKNNEASS